MEDYTCTTKHALKMIVTTMLSLHERCTGASNQRIKALVNCKNDRERTLLCYGKRIQTFIPCSKKVVALAWRYNPD